MTTAKPASRQREFKPRLVHAYRRDPHKNMEGREVEVPVHTNGETIKFKSNDLGHVVGLVTTEAAFKRLVNEIPEAYIEYKGGENVPETRIAPPSEQEPTGKYVLVNGKRKLALDDLTDDELRQFVDEQHLQVHPDLTGEDLMKAIYNLCQTG